MVLRRWFVCRGLKWTADPVDHTRSRTTEQIGKQFLVAGSEAIFQRRVDHEIHEIHERLEIRARKSRRRPKRSAENVRTKSGLNAASHCRQCQRPKFQLVSKVRASVQVQVLAGMGINGPASHALVPGVVLRHSRQAWMSGVGAEERLGSPRTRG